MKLTEQLRKTAGVDQTVVFGSALHVSSSDHAALESAVKQVLSGFIFPFAGMPLWARLIGNLLPLTYFNRLIRGILLKGNGWVDRPQYGPWRCLRSS